MVTQQRIIEAVLKGTFNEGKQVRLNPADFKRFQLPREGLEEVRLWCGPTVAYICADESVAPDEIKVL